MIIECKFNKNVATKQQKYKKKLLDSFAKRQSQENAYGTLYKLVMQGNADEVKKIVSEYGLDLNKPIGDLGLSALIIACRKGDEGMVETLLKLGADPNYQVSAHASPDQYSQISGLPMQVIKGIIDNKLIPLDLKQQISPMSAAIAANHYSIVLHLIDAGVTLPVKAKLQDDGREEYVIDSSSYEFGFRKTQFLSVPTVGLSDTLREGETVPQAIVRQLAAPALSLGQDELETAIQDPRISTEMSLNYVLQNAGRHEATKFVKIQNLIITTHILNLHFFRELEKACGLLCTTEAANLNSGKIKKHSARHTKVKSGVKLSTKDHDDSSRDTDNVVGSLDVDVEHDTSIPETDESAIRQNPTDISLPAFVDQQLVYESEEEEGGVSPTFGEDEYVAPVSVDRSILSQALVHFRNQVAEPTVEVELVLTNALLTYLSGQHDEAIALLETIQDVEGMDYVIMHISAILECHEIKGAKELVLQLVTNPQLLHKYFQHEYEHTFAKSREVAASDGSRTPQWALPEHGVVTAKQSGVYKVASGMRDSFYVYIPEYDLDKELNIGREELKVIPRYSKGQNGLKFNKGVCYYKAVHAGDLRPSGEAIYKNSHGENLIVLERNTHNGVIDIMNREDTLKIISVKETIEYTVMYVSASYDPTVLGEAEQQLNQLDREIAEERKVLHLVDDQKQCAVNTLESMRTAIINLANAKHTETQSTPTELTETSVNVATARSIEVTAEEKEYVLNTLLLQYHRLLSAVSGSAAAPAPPPYPYPDGSDDEPLYSVGSEDQGEDQTGEFFGGPSSFGGSNSTI
ncbi:ankyrin repeat domain-containing protein [Rickettsiales endosymbiont of Peranema trichophorum]|uniref:hypothetical protein n=1 Tax=Rickettsiales endosymbiont of Peranema trichophorum TaxID=2486577 RepID=UPI0010EA6BD8|nr:hypothetical protein [Rickettsiales endosymbiont of Peranema trichophorum]RZI47772.1 ankyrin repeat domain-containing protein [Rickettsiales endosymbiont of Peranema trichophorum]